MSENIADEKNNSVEEVIQSKSPKNEVKNKELSNEESVQNKQNESVNNRTRESSGLGKRLRNLIDSLFSKGNETPSSISTSNDIGKTLWDLIGSLFSSWGLWFRFLLTCLILGLISLGVLWGVLYILKTNKLEVIETKGGGIIYRTGRDETLSYFLAASAPWDSPKGFKANNGEILTIRASGRVNLAVHHLVDSAKADTFPQLVWNSPAGVTLEDEKKMQKQDKYREQFVLNPECNYGALIAGISPSEDKPPSNGDEIWCVGNENEHKVKKDGGYLWFAVNDVLLHDDDKSKNIYEVPQNKTDNNYKSPRKWDDYTDNEGKTIQGINRAGYYNLFFDDNIGGFMIVVKKDN